MRPWIQYDHFICKKANKQVISFDNLSFQSGDIVGIIGENGAGKSTLLNALSLLESPVAGTMIYKGQPVNLQDPPLAIRREWACVFQHSHRFVGSVYENVEIGLKLRKINKAERKDRVFQWLEKFKISHLATEKAHNLSGGEAQRMNLARAFVLNPTVLFLDEPFSALDFPTKMTLLEELQLVLKDTRTTTFLISHDMIDIELLASDLLFLHNGRIEDQGRLADVLSNPSSSLTSFLEPWQKVRNFNSSNKQIF